MIIKFEEYRLNEKLGISDDVLNASTYVSDIINKSNDIFYIIPIKLGKFEIELNLNIKSEQINGGNFSPYLSNNNKIYITLKNRKSYVDLVHELKHAYRFLLKKGSDSDKLQSYYYNSRMFNKENKNTPLLHWILYFLNINEFESQYHSMYFEIKELKEKTKEKIDDITSFYRTVIEKYPINLNKIFNDDEKSKILFLYKLKNNIIENKNGTYQILNKSILKKIEYYLKSNEIISLSEKDIKDIEILQKDIEKSINKNIEYIKRKLYRLYVI